MHLHVNPKDMVSHKSCSSNLSPKTRPKRCASCKCVLMLPQSLGTWSLQDGINLNEAKGGQHVPLKAFTVQNDYLSDHVPRLWGNIKTHLQEAHRFGLVLGLKFELQLLCETMSFGFTCRCMMWGCGFPSVVVIGN